MTPGISIVRVGEGVDPGLVAKLPEALTAVLHVPCSIEPEILDISSAFDPGRRQYRVDGILQIMSDGVHHRGGVRRLGVAAHDLFAYACLRRGTTAGPLRGCFALPFARGELWSGRVTAAFRGASYQGIVT